jgi:hypothetical protein
MSHACQAPTFGIEPSKVGFDRSKQNASVSTLGFKPSSQRRADPPLDIERPKVGFDPPKQGFTDPSLGT